MEGLVEDGVAEIFIIDLHRFGLVLSFFFFFNSSLFWLLGNDCVGGALAENWNLKKSTTFIIRFASLLGKG